MGKESILALAKHDPSHVYFTGRDSDRAAIVINKVKAIASHMQLTFLECDQSSLLSVEAVAKKFTSQCETLDILMCNAGVMALPPGLTKDGYEVQFGVNHIGHALFVKLLLPTLLRTAKKPDSDVRIVFLTSLGWRGHPKGGIVFNGLRTVQNFGPAGVWIRYGQSKLANILYAAELARRYPNIIVSSVHPGVANTGLVSNLSVLHKAIVYITNWGALKAPADIVANQLWAATGERREITNGGYYEPIGVPGKLDGDAKSGKLRFELWDWTQKELERYQI